MLDPSNPGFNYLLSNPREKIRPNLTFKMIWSIITIINRLDEDNELANYLPKTEYIDDVFEFRDSLNKMFLRRIIDVTMTNNLAIELRQQSDKAYEEALEYLKKQREKEQNDTEE